MSKPHGIIVFGSNGSGKTTLGRELACILDFKHMDHEDYAFKESEVPYSNQRSDVECIELMLADIEKHRSFVISAVTGNFGDKTPSFYELAIFISTPVRIRRERIKQRAYHRYGERILEGGDMYKQHLKFVDFATSRSLSPIEQWAEILTCPVIYVNGTDDCRQIAVDIANRFYAKP